MSDAQDKEQPANAPEELRSEEKPPEHSGDKQSEESPASTPEPRGLQLPDDEKEDDAAIRVMGTSARATKEKRRTQILVRGAREPAQAAIAPDVTLEGQLILYVLDELPEEERNRVRAEIREEASAEERLNVIRRHLEIHQSLPSAKPSRASFLRLTRRMKDEGHLTYAYPGSQAIWRRGFGYALMAAAIMATLMTLGFFTPAVETKKGIPFGSFIAVADDGSSNPRAITLNTPLSTNTNGGSIWLATPRSRVATEIRCDGAASFSLLSRSHLMLDSGVLDRVQVSSAALYKRGFLIETRYGTIRAHDGEFSVDARSGRTVVNVARGRVEVQRANGSELRVVTDGQCAELSESKPKPTLYPFVSMEINAYNPLRGERVALVKVINKSQHQIRIRSFSHMDGELYPAFLAKDYEASDGENLTYSGTLLEHRPEDLDSWGREDEEGWVTLEGFGKADTYQFVVEFTTETQSWPVRDMAISMRYMGDIDVHHFGLLHFPINSDVARLNLKDLDEE